MAYGQLSRATSLDKSRSQKGIAGIEKRSICAFFWYMAMQPCKEDYIYMGLGDVFNEYTHTHIYINLK